MNQGLVDKEGSSLAARVSRIIGKKSRTIKEKERIRRVTVERVAYSGRLKFKREMSTGESSTLERRF